MSQLDDRLFNLLPRIYHLRDAERGDPLRALLSVIDEQVAVVEDDITGLYENWFVETCDDWVVPYIADLLGHEPVRAARADGSAAPRALARVLAPRREIARVIHNRRRKGTLAVLESLAVETGGWPARVVERFRQLGWTQHVNFARPGRGRLLDLRDAAGLELLETPFDRAAHAVDVRSRGLTRVDAFVWRLPSYPVTWTQARCIDNRPNCYTFSILGNDAPLYTHPDRGTSPDDIASELDVPTPIRLQAFEVRGPDGRAQADPRYYGPGRSVEVRVDGGGACRTFGPEAVTPADLSGWHYEPAHGRVAIDPVRGRLAFDREQPGEVWVRYHYGFSAEMGGGEYDRAVSQPANAAVFYVGLDDPGSCSKAEPGRPQPAGPEPLYPTIAEALRAAYGRHDAVIEITDSRLYEESLRMAVPPGGSLQVRAANGKRPVIQIPDRVARRDALRIQLGAGSRLTLDGLLIAGRAVQFVGTGDDEHGPRIVVRHCTLVPGWSLDEHCRPSDAEEPSIELRDTAARVRIERSIVGSIQISQNEVKTDPVCLEIEDSIVDATSPAIDAFSGPEACSFAFATLTIARSTVLGRTQVHAVRLAEDSIFHGLVQVARRQIGCMRFCYVPRRSRTPRRYECQPDLVVADLATDAERDLEAHRVEPRFGSMRYGSPVYAQLSLDCAREIAAGASDESEMGAFHDLFQPQRLENLRVRLHEYVPASIDVDIVIAS